MCVDTHRSLIGDRTLGAKVTGGSELSSVGARN